MLLPHLEPGSDLSIVLANSLRLIKQGMPKGQAMATALEVAGYRPPSSPRSTSSSSDNPPTPTPPA